MKQLFHINLLILLALLLIPSQSFAAATGITAEHALDSLKNGNMRFVRLKLTNTDYNKQIEKTKDAQHPFVAVLSCMDSRVPPEIIFDQGIGNIFVAREAGNVVSANTLGSLEYAVNVKKVALVVVMGHSGCGAVAAAVDGTELSAYRNLEQLINQIKPATRNCKDNIYQCTEKSNIKLSISEMLRNSQPISDAVKNNEVKVIGAYYDISSGIVTFDTEYSFE
jgi:carbonic anhydrase